MNEDIEQKCLEDIKGLIENYGKLIRDLSKMESAERQELNVTEGMALIGMGIWTIENRFYDMKVKKAKSDADE